MLESNDSPCMITLLFLLMRLSLWYMMEDRCVDNCSGHGDCYEGICFCELLCVKSEYGRMKSPSMLKACQITTQKALYILICIATSIRGFYFSSPENAALQWTSSLLSAYYPILITGSSLIVCFWAEVFHLQDKTLDRPSFLSKSFFGFVAFNIVTYSLLLAELVLLQLEDRSESEKLRGGFVQNSATPTNTSQLHQSRVGLVSQGVLLLITIAFIISDTLGSSWKDKVHVLSRNCHDVIFRVVEMGVALWFPCVLWNCVRPEQLWILNPRKILMKLEADKPAQTTEEESLVSSSKEVAVRAVLNNSLEKLSECWICYDSERQDVGPLIQPCLCKGDVSVVHHDCLKKWLVQSTENPDNMKCKVCKVEYKLERGTVQLPRGLTKVHWLQTSSVVMLMCATVGGACLLVKMFDTVAIRTATVGVALLVQCICLRLLGFSFLTAYHRAKFSTIRILENKPTGIATVSRPQTKLIICGEVWSSMDVETTSERTFPSTVSSQIGTEVTIEAETS
ncbi:uncharacterized protein LOC143252215 isoform X4 [Tachypleus tridentatus]|uniref:uncharacterized protein LOC143252215 isoform X4 n=1 Tax=Tachypleus tridentatus TaxID=6853 RepID=UPI003FCF8838